MQRFICSILVTVTACLTSAFYFDANAQGLSLVPRAIRALGRAPHAGSFLKQASKTPLGKALSHTSVLPEEWPTNTDLQFEVLKQVMMQDTYAFKRLISGTGQFSGAELAQLIEKVARYHALGGPPVEVRPVDSIEFLKTYERIKKNAATRGCKIATEICVRNDKTISFSFGCGGANVQLTTAGQVSLTAPLPNGKKYSVPIIGEP